MSRSSRHARLSLFAAGALSAALGCAGPPPPPPVAPTAPVEEPPPPPPEWTLRSTAPIVAGEAVDSGRQGSAAILVFGVARVRVAGRQIEEAAQRTLSPIAAFSEFGESWIAVTTAGEVFRADEPLGDLHPVGSLGAPLGDVGSVAERLALLDLNGRLFVGDLEGIAPVDTAEPVVDACFVSSTFGVRLDAGGATLRTNDGGQSWTPVEFADDPGTPAHIYPRGDGVMLETATGRIFRVKAEELLEMQGQPAAAGGHSALRSSTLDAAKRWTHERGSLMSGFTADGRLLVGAGAARVRVFPDGPELAVPEHCESIVAGADTFWARCRGRWFRTDGESDFAAVALPGAVSELVFDAASSWVAGRGSCDGRDHQAVCLFDSSGGSEPRTVAVAGLQSVVGFADGRLLGNRQVEWSGRVFAVELTAATLADLEPPMTHQLVAVTDGGTLLVHDPAEGGYLIGEPDDLRPVALPEPFPSRRLDATEGQRLIALDEEHLVAALHEQVWTSSDGGQSFEELPAARHAYRRRVTPTHCNSRGCDLGDLLWAPEDVVPEYQPSIAHAAEGVILDLEQWHVETLTSSVACEMPLRWSGAPFLTPPPQLGGPRQMVAGGWMRIRGSSRDPYTGGPLTAEFGGVDSEGQFTVRARPGAVPELEALEAAPYAEVETRLLSVTRQLALLERRRMSGEHILWDLVAVGPHLRPRTVVRMQDLSETFEFAPRIAGALPDIGGGVVVRTTSEVDEVTGRTHFRVDELLRVSPDGDVRIRVFESGPFPSRRWLGRDAQGEPGLYVERVGEARWVGFDGAVSAPLPRPPETVDQLCVPDQARFLEVLTPGYPPHPPRMALRSWHGAPKMDARVVVALDAEGHACVREAWTMGAPPVEAAPLLTGALHLGSSRQAPIGRVIPLGGRPALAIDCSLVEWTEGGWEEPSARAAERGDGDVVLGTLVDGTIGMAVARVRPGGEHSFTTRSWTFWVLRDQRWVQVGEEIEVEDSSSTVRFAGGLAAPTIAEEWGAEVRLLNALGQRSRATELARWGVGASAFSLSAVEGGVTGAVAGESGSAPIRLARAPERAAIARGAEGFGGVVLHCGRSTEPGASELGCELTGVDLGAEPGRRASMAFEAVGSDDWIFAAEGGRLAVLVVRRPGTGSGVRQLSLDVVALDGRRPRRVGASLPLTALPYGDERALGLMMTPSPRVAYVDAPSDGAPEHIRVAELGRRGWVDLAPPWPLVGASSASMSAAGVVVATLDEDGSVRSARLDGSRWLRLPPIPAPRPD